MRCPSFDMLSSKIPWSNACFAAHFLKMWPKRPSFIDFSVVKEQRKNQREDPATTIEGCFVCLFNCFLRSEQLITSSGDTRFMKN